MKFFFCETCGKRVTDADVEAGQARNKKLKGVFCKDCAVGVMTMEMLPVSEDDARKILSKESASAADPSQQAGSVSAKPRRDSAAGHLPAARKPSESSVPLRLRTNAGTTAHSRTGSSALVGVVAGLAIAMVLGLFLLFSGGNKTSPSAGAKNVSSADGPSHTATPTTPAEPQKPLATRSDAIKSTPTASPAPSKTADEPQQAAVTPPSSPVSVETKTSEPEPAKELPAPAPIQAAPPPAPTKQAEDDLKKRFAEVLKELTPLLRRGQFVEAEKLLDEKLHAPEWAGISDQLKREKADVAEVWTLRLSAIDALRAKAGTPIGLVLQGAKQTGVIKADPNSQDVVFALRNGPEFKITAAQLDLEDICRLLPMAQGTEKAEQMRVRGLLFMAAGDTTMAERYFGKARDKGLGHAIDPYLDRISASKLEEKEGAALEAWKKAEGLFAAKNWQSAKQAYESFKRDHAGTAVLTDNSETLGKRLEAIDDALGRPKVVTLDLGGGVKLELMLISAGEFEMGSNDGAKNEKPVRKVKLTHSFYMGKYHVTQAQYQKVADKNPSSFKGDSLPVECVNFPEAEEFCNKVSKLTGQTVRLPSEAEWEYACRAGTKTNFNTGDNDTALKQAGWYSENAGGVTHPVGQKKPNAWGLYDMHGNVYQWCRDWFEDDYYAKAPAEDPQGPATGNNHTVRGGSWFHTLSACNSASRAGCEPTARYHSVGFRVVMAPPIKTP